MEVEALAGSEGLAVEVGGAEDEGAGPVGESAGSGSGGCWFEHASVWTRGSPFARAGGLALRDAGDAAEDGAECAAQNVGRFAFGEVNGLTGEKGKAQGLQLKEQTLILLKSCACRYLLLLNEEARTNAPLDRCVNLCLVLIPFKNATRARISDIDKSRGKLFSSHVSEVGAPTRLSLCAKLL